MGKLDEIEDLILRSRKLDRRAAAVQGDRELLVDREDVDQIADDYQRW